MISVPEARKLIAQWAAVLSPVSCSLKEAGGRILAGTIISNLDVPPFDQSAMDGYAFLFDPNKINSSLQVIGEVPAGMHPGLKPGAGEAVRIFTGAPLPEGTDTVVMQEKVQVVEHVITIQDAFLKRGSNVRLRASQTKAGAVALKAGTRLSPGSIGFLAGLGLTQVSVIPVPHITLIITGRELVKPGLPLGPGQIYESNSFALSAALGDMDLKPLAVYKSDDDEKQITDYLNGAISASDLVIVTGGISVGDYDLVKKGMDNCGVDTVFYKVRQKPGKPLYFGRKDNVLLFGLPGNPSAVLTCFYEYIGPAIRQMMGLRHHDILAVRKKLAAGFTKKAGLTYFLKGKIDGDEVMPLQAQESFQMGSFAEADCLIQLDENKTDYARGEVVEVHMLTSETSCTS